MTKDLVAIRMRRMPSYIGYMCRTEYESDLQLYGASVWASAELVKEKQSCADSCGIVEVEIKLLRHVQIGTDHNEPASISGIGPRKTGGNELEAAQPLPHALLDRGGV